MGWSKNWKYGFPWESAHANKLLKGIRNAGNAAADERIAGGEFAAGVSREQRDWSDKNIRPIERGLSEVLRKRLAAGGQDGVTADAMAGTGEAFDRSQEGAARSASRFGVNIDPEFSRSAGLDRTKYMIEAGTMAAREDRDAAGRDAQRFYQAGRSLPGLATQQFIAGAGSIADQGDFDTGRQVGEALGKTDTQSGLSDNFADGGQVGGVGRVIDGRSKRVDLNGGDFIIPEFAVEFYGREFLDKLVAENGGEVDDIEAADSGGEPMDAEPGYARGGEMMAYADGGNVLDTARLKNKHTEEYSAGETDKQFPEWLEANGYTMADGQAERQDTVVARAPRRPDKRPRTPDFLFQPREYQPKRYADGGGVGAGLGEGIRRGYAGSLAPVVGAIKTGLTAGLLDARTTDDHERRVANDTEDRAYLREDRAYQTGQRQKAELKAAYDRDIDDATARFVQSDGIDLSPIIGVRKKYSKDAEGDIQVGQNQDGTFNLTAVGSKGEASPPQKVSRDDLRSLGMNMIEAMRDPKALIKSWNEKPTTVNTPYGGVTSAFDPRTRKWSRIEDNNSDLRAVQGGVRGGGGANVLGWKDHNAMNDDLERRSKRYLPRGAMGELLDPLGPEKVRTYTRIVSDKLTATGKSPRDMTMDDFNRASSEAESMIDEDYRRRGATRLKGDGEGVFNRFNADLVAADMAAYFPRGGSEQELRLFMAKNAITDTADQDEVIQKLGAYPPMQTSLGVGRPAARPDAPTAKPGQRNAADVKAEYKAGRISREQAVGELKSMGFQ